jgi:hypothetical protein
VKARFFIIKSYTEDDVYRSVKHEIWSSTDLGNKRLDKAFKESAGRGPIYLFFSVNARYAALRAHKFRFSFHFTASADTSVAWLKC